MVVIFFFWWLCLLSVFSFSLCYLSVFLIRLRLFPHALRVKRGISGFVFYCSTSKRYIHTQLLLTPKFWILPLHRDFVNSAEERARGCTGLVICKENKEQKGKRKYHAGTPHPNDRGGFTQWFGSCSLMSTLYVWFPASWAMLKSFLLWSGIAGQLLFAKSCC